jgi:hypothetical protein
MGCGIRFPQLEWCEMIPKEMLRQIAEQLLEKSRANEVAWKREADTTPTLGIPMVPVVRARFLPEPFEYVLHLPNSQVRLKYNSRSTAPDNVVMRLCHSDGSEVGQFSAEENEDDWKLLADLYTEAHRSVTGWDQVVNDISRAVRENGLIGQR